MAFLLDLLKWLARRDGAAASLRLQYRRFRARQSAPELTNPPVLQATAGRQERAADRTKMPKYAFDPFVSDTNFEPS